MAHIKTIKSDIKEIIPINLIKFHRMNEIFKEYNKSCNYFMSGSTIHNHFPGIIS